MRKRDRKEIKIGKWIIKKVFTKRAKEAKKGDFGKLLVVGGSKLYHGSPAFNALAAYRSGVDLVFILAPERAANIIASFSPDLITYPLSGDYITKEHLETILSFAKKSDALVIGGGMGRERETLDAIKEILIKVTIPCVIDADAIYAVAENKDILKKNFILTPHRFEFKVLSGISIENMEKSKKMVKDVAKKLNSIILLKGPIDIISDGYRIAINETGNPYMTKGGTGDTLAGICGSLLAQGKESFLSACCAAYINGKAGDIVAKKKREALLASDIIDAIPEVLKNR
ncbi:MAG: NAD(P)H-hydrate dehydratase [Candidatus Aenigmatarchaeota archaeon]|nr:NAD(P)H-hydrate dehydratase [Candidatus Aenigmarchaeota archaeon]